MVWTSNLTVSTGIVGNTLSGLRREHPIPLFRQPISLRGLTERSLAHLISASPLRIPPICALSAERAGFSLLRPAGSSFLLLEVLAFHFRSPVNHRSFGFGGYAFSHIGGPEVIPACCWGRTATFHRSDQSLDSRRIAFAVDWP